MAAWTAALRQLLLFVAIPFTPSRTENLYPRGGKSFSKNYSHISAHKFYELKYERKPDRVPISDFLLLFVRSAKDLGNRGITSPQLLPRWWSGERGSPCSLEPSATPLGA